MARTKYYDETSGLWKYADASGGTGPGGAVNSVNGKTGDVYLTAADVKARPDDWNPVVTAVIAPHGSGSKADMTASEIINAARKGVVLADYTDPSTGELRTYPYFKQTVDGKAVFAINGYIEVGTPKQTLIYVDYAGNVTTETRDATAVGIGAAPSGFGAFGEELVEIATSSDNDGKQFEAMLDAQLGKMPYGSTTQVRWSDNPFFDGYTFSGVLTKFDNGENAVLTGISVGRSYRQVSKMKVSGKWYQFNEYSADPDIKPGVEVETTRSFNGSRVYAKLIEFAHAEETFFNIPHGIIGLSSVVSVSAVIYDEGFNYTLPYIRSDGMQVNQHTNVDRVSSTDITFRSRGVGWTPSASWRVLIEYTKEE